MSPIKGRENMLCRPAGFSDNEDDDDDYDSTWTQNRAPKTQTKQRRQNPRDQFEAAIRDDDLDAVKLALKNGANVNDVDMGGFTGLMQACSFGHPQIVRYLIEQESQVNVCNRSLVYPLMVVSFSSCTDESRLVDCARTLIAEYANVNDVDVHGTTALMFACKSGRTTLVAELVRSEANVHAADTQKWTALHHAVNAGNVEAVEILLAAGARKRVRDAQGRMPFQIAMTRPKLKDLAARLCPKRFRHTLEPTENLDLLEFRLEETAYQAFNRKMNAVNETLRDRRPLKLGDKPNLYEFLTTTDTELSTLGLKRSWHRRQTLEFIKGYLLLPWPRLVQPKLSKFGEVIAQWNADKGIVYKSSYPKLTYLNSAHLLVGVATRLEIVRASVKYMEMNLGEDVVDEIVRGQIEMTKVNVKLMEHEVGKLMKSLELHDGRPILPADLIVGKATDGGRCLTCVKVVGVVCVLAFGVWKAKGSLFLTR